MDERINKLLNHDESIIDENANKNGNVLSTMRDLLAGEVSKDFALRQILPKKIADAHTSGDIHFHDLLFSPTLPFFNCMLIDFKGMFEKGFTIGDAEIESPKSIRTATALIAQIVANVSSNMYGGVSFNRADEVLEKYAKMSFDKYIKQAKEFFNDKNKIEDFAYKMTKKEIYDSMQSLEYEINTLFSSQGQVPFFSFNFGLGESWFAREIQKTMLKVRINGIGKHHKTAIFPKLIFTLKRGLNLTKDDPNYDIKKLALECSSKRIYPDILSYDKIKDLLGYFISPMGCRSFLPAYKENGKYITNGRNNLGVVTLNIPRIALESKGNKEEFWKIFDEKMQIVYEALMFRVNTLKKVKAKNAPILYQYGATGKRLDPEEPVFDIFKDGRASVSIGYIGLYEAATVFYGSEWEHNHEAKQFTIDIMKRLAFFRDQWKEKEHLGFSIYATPSESLTDRFCRLDKKLFGSVKDITDKDYYTNSFHYDVRKKINPFEKIDFEKDYDPYTTGGFIHYCECPSLRNNLKALESIWDYAYDRIGFYGTNVPIDRCFQCDYEGEFKATVNGFVCPNCGNNDPETTSCIRRLCGYLGSVIQRKPIAGRLKEINSRVKHMDDQS